jgi:hypothetical protein
MAHSIAIPTRALSSAVTCAVSPAAVLRHAPVLATAALEFAGLLTFLSLCVGLIVEFS